MIDIRHGDSRDVLKTLADSSIDSVVCDPPYALVSIVKRFGKEGSAAAAGNEAYARASAGFMGKTWDTGETAFAVEFWAEVMRVLKPGGHVVAFSGTRTYHRLAVAIEDAGFEIRDMLQWLYGSGFPKSHDVAKGIDKSKGVAGSFGEPKSTAHAGWIDRGRMRGDLNEDGWQRPWMDDAEKVSNAARRYIAGSPEAEAWRGWGTALKPACEPIVLARKPLAGTVAGNVLAHGTGALNIDGCRVEGDMGPDRADGKPRRTDNDKYGKANSTINPQSPLGRWPANVAHDGSDEVLSLFPDSDGQQGDVTGREPSSPTNGIYGDFAGRPAATARGDAGSAARFFYTAKADATDRLGSKHPTVKPTDLMRWLCRLVTPPGGLVLDPFAGSGSTGVAAVFEGFDAILIEREPEYVDDIRRRIAWAQGDGRLTILEKKRPPQKEPMEGDLF